MVNQGFSTMSMSEADRLKTIQAVADGHMPVLAVTPIAIHTGNIFLATDEAMNECAPNPNEHHELIEHPRYLMRMPVWP